jgi:hypothetical protein
VLGKEPAKDGADRGDRELDAEHRDERGIRLVTYTPLDDDTRIRLEQLSSAPG